MPLIGVKTDKKKKEITGKGTPSEDLKKKRALHKRRRRQKRQKTNPWYISLRKRRIMVQKRLKRLLALSIKQERQEQHRDVLLPKKIKNGIVKMIKIISSSWLFQRIMRDVRVDISNLDFSSITRRMLEKEAASERMYSIIDNSFRNDRGALNITLRPHGKLTPYRETDFKRKYKHAKEKDVWPYRTTVSDNDNNDEPTIIPCFMTYNPSKPDDAYLWVRRDFRGYGYAKILVDGLKVNSICAIKPAFRFWKRMGFIRSGRKNKFKNCYEMYRGKYDVVLSGTFKDFDGSWNRKYDDNGIMTESYINWMSKKILDGKFDEVLEYSTHRDIKKFSIDNKKEIERIMKEEAKGDSAIMRDEDEDEGEDEEKEQILRSFSLPTPPYSI